MLGICPHSVNGLLHVCDFMVMGHVNSPIYGIRIPKLSLNLLEAELVPAHGCKVL